LDKLITQVCLEKSLKRHVPPPFSLSLQHSPAQPLFPAKPRARLAAAAAPRYPFCSQQCSEKLSAVLSLGWSTEALELQCWASKTPRRKRPRSPGDQELLLHLVRDSRHLFRYR